MSGNFTIDRLHRERTGLSRARLSLLCFIAAYQREAYGYGPSFAAVTDFCLETLGLAKPYVLTEMQRAGYVMRGDGLVVLGYVLTERGEAKLGELMAEEQAGAAE